MHSCPLETNVNLSMQRPISIYLRPEAASSRVLSLDSGGIRAIVQLEVLRLLEEEWLDKLSIRYFFDLIVGSGSGALIALGIATKGWSIKKCGFHVERILTQAFTKRTGRGLPGIGLLLESVSREKWDSEALDFALKEAFGEDEPLFGALRSMESSASASNVAVTATSSSGSPVLFASYNRRCVEPLPYEFKRPDRPEQEIKLWEAARAAMATPRLFKPFFHEETKQIYSSAKPRHLNPIHLADSERRILKQDLDCPDAPDLIVSLGTAVEEDLIEHTCVSHSVSSSNVSEISTVCNCAKRKSRSHKRNSSSVRCQTTSDDFIRDFPTSATSHLRFVRFNPPAAEKLPQGDDIKSLESLRKTVHDQIDKSEVKALAAKLLATLFYFETQQDLAQQADGQWVSIGMIRCRIPNETSEMCSLGKLLSKRSATNPRFVVQDEGRQTQVFEIPAEVTAEMVVDSKFAMTQVQILLPQRFAVVDMLLFLDGRDRNSISGFPRHLAKPESKANRK